MFHSLRLTASLFKPLTTLTKVPTYTGGQSLNIYRTFYKSIPRSSRQTSNIIQVRKDDSRVAWLLHHETIFFQKKLLEPKNALKTAICRYCSEANKNTKTKKIVGYWLLGSSGMVFVAVVLGAVSAYYGFLYCFYVVIEEIIKITIR